MDELTARSESSDTSQGDLEDEISSLWRELQEHRDNVKDTKNKMAEVRRKLRLLRKQKTDADNNFMNALRPLLVNRITIRRDALSQLESRVLPMQKLRTEYQDLETTYEELEDTLDEKEQLLGWVELRFFSILGTGQGNNGQTPKPMHQRNDVPLELRGISSHRPLEDFHPLFVELTIVIASLQNSKDELHDLLAKRAQYSSEIDPTSVNGIEASRRAQDFLAHFPIQEQKMRDNVRKNEAEFNRLKKICEEKEIMGKHVSIHTDMILHPDKVFEDIELIEVPPSLNGRKTLAHERFSELLSQPDHLLSEPEPLTAFAALKAALALPDDDPRKPGRKRLAVKEISIDRLLQTTPEKESKSEFINRWLLYNLRISPLETIMLYSITSSVFALQDLAIKNLLGWQCDVLYHWPRDDTAHESDMNIEAQEGSDYYMRPRTGSWSHGVSQDSTLREPTV
jgi:hypothetical protein